ncbi:hypothetical protein [Vibrio jasicida]|uniref:hypothetical protein n=1 Tax=Vibrio jasicida TaxID=766224 RepID=UPI000C9C3D58|nr:hypothetical protein [Vibrio jasicida]
MKNLTTLTFAIFYTVARGHVEDGTKRIIKNNFIDKSTVYEESFDFISQLEDVSQAELNKRLSIIGQGFSRDT